MDHVEGEQGNLASVVFLLVADFVLKVIQSIIAFVKSVKKSCLICFLGSIIYRSFYMHFYNKI